MSFWDADVKVNVNLNQPLKGKLSELTYDNKFAYDFCSCCVDCKLCCCGTFCLPCLICQLYMDTGEGCCSGCWQCFTSFIPLNFCCSNTSMLRSKLRGTFKLHGSILEDKYYTTCCPCCAAIQLKLELRNQDKLNDYFQYFKSELKPQEVKKFYLKLIQLESDIDNLISSSIFHSDDSLKEFIDTNLRKIHKNLFLEKDIDSFLNEVKNKYNFILSTNAVDKNMIKSRDWRQKDNNYKKSQYLENFEYDREKLGLDKNSKTMIFKSKTEKNSEFMNRKFNDIGHKFFNDDLFESDDDNHLSDFL